MNDDLVSRSDTRPVERALGCDVGLDAGCNGFCAVPDGDNNAGAGVSFRRKDGWMARVSRTANIFRRRPAVWGIVGSHWAGARLDVDDPALFRMLSGHRNFSKSYSTDCLARCPGNWHGWRVILGRGACKRDMAHRASVQGNRHNAIRMGSRIYIGRIDCSGRAPYSWMALAFRSRSLSRAAGPMDPQGSS